METKTILVVDDDIDVLESVAELIEMLGYSVLVAENGEKSVDIYGTHSDVISGVLLDVSLPGMSGEEIYNYFHTKDPNLPIIMTSGYSSESVQGFAGIASQPKFLQKPYNIQQIRDILSEAVSSGTI